MQRCGPCKRRELWKKNAECFPLNPEVMFFSLKPNWTIFIVLCFRNSPVPGRWQSHQVRNWTDMADLQKFSDHTLPQALSLIFSIYFFKDWNILRHGLLQQHFRVGYLQVILGTAYSDFAPLPFSFVRVFGGRWEQLSVRFNFL